MHIELNSVISEYGEILNLDAEILDYAKSIAETNYPYASVPYEKVALAALYVSARTSSTCGAVSLKVWTNKLEKHYNNNPDSLSYLRKINKLIAKMQTATEETPRVCTISIESFVKQIIEMLDLKLDTVTEKDLADLSIWVKESRKIRGTPRGIASAIVYLCFMLANLEGRTQNRVTQNDLEHSIQVSNVCTRRIFHEILDSNISLAKRVSSAPTKFWENVPIYT